MTPTLVRISMIFFCLIGVDSWAFYSTMTTSEVPPPESQNIIGEVQYFGPIQALALKAHWERGISDELGYILSAGIGASLFGAGGAIKWMPFPDLENQPGAGVLAELFLARFEGSRDFSLRLHPLVSKKFHTKIGEIHPYAALPFGYALRGDESKFPIHLTVGSRFEGEKFESFALFLEFGIALKDGVSYGSLGVQTSFK